LVEVSGFQSFLTFLTGVDAFSLLFPFILAWLLYYAAIEKTGIFNEGSLNNFAPVVSLLLAFFTARFLVTVPFYQSFFADFFGKVVIGLASLLGLYTLLSFSGWDFGGGDDIDDYIKWIGAAMAGAAFIWAGGFGPAIFGAEEIGGGAGAVISTISSLLFESGFFWLLIIGAPLAYLMIQDGDDPPQQQGQGNP
jgi:hypothetical protein